MIKAARFVAFPPPFCRVAGGITAERMPASCANTEPKGVRQRMKAIQVIILKRMRPGTEISKLAAVVSTWAKDA